MQKHLAKLILRAVEIYDKSYADDAIVGREGTYTKSRYQAIEEAWQQESFANRPIPIALEGEKERWLDLLHLLLTDPLWNDSQDWAKRVLAE